MTVPDLESRLAALEAPKRERNSEGIAGLVLATAATAALYGNYINEYVWGAMCLADLVCYMIIRLKLKLNGGTT